MDKLKLGELIDQYLLGTIRPEDKTYLDACVQKNPEAADMLKESRQAFRVIRAEQNYRMREKLRDLDRRQAFQAVRSTKWLLLILTLITLVYVWWFGVAYYYKPSALAKRNFEWNAPGKSSVYFHGRSDLWIAAEETFRRKSYQTAADMYSTILQHEQEREAIPYAEWNLLLTKLAVYGPTREWKKDVQIFASKAPEPLHAKALRLLEFLDSAWYKKFLVKFLGPLPAIKTLII